MRGFCEPRSLFSVAVCAGVAASAVAFASSAQAQVQDLNIQSRIQTFTTPLELTTKPRSEEIRVGEKGQPAPPQVCASDAQVAVFLFHYADRFRFTMPQTVLAELAKHTFKTPQDKETWLTTYLAARPQETANILYVYFRYNRDRFDAEVANMRREAPAHGPKSLLAINYAVSLCHGQQPLTVKATLPFNPDYESNVLKSNKNANDSPGTSAGFGGNLQVTTGGFRDYDVMGLSVGTASARYGNYSSKSFDSVNTQGGYQFFIDAFRGNGHLVDLPSAADQTPKDLPPSNMIAMEAITLGFVSQAAYTTPFHLETTELFTPQVTWSLQNVSLAGGGRDNECRTASQDFRKDGFCYYANFALTVGQTVSDVQSQQNTNVAASAAPGLRIQDTDWSLSLPTTATLRSYNNFPGGRDDVLFQIGPALSYAPDAFRSPAMNAAVAFSVSATYNQNFSNVSAATWHGIVVLPTLTVAFLPNAAAK